MDTFETIFTRRSIRSFTPQEISETDITHILSAAMSAPSAGNAQPWDFIVVRDQAGREAITQCTPYAGMAPQAPVCVIVCADTSREKYPGFWVQDCAAAMQNLLLAARAKDIGSVWIGIHPVEDRIATVKKLFGLPAQVMPLGIAVLGYSDQKFTEHNRYNAAKVHHETW
ncbi:MAG: nitroreductase family protein [Desulfovibrionaceae bacterium]